ncbi:hemagglutinin repeat-containing protein [Dialister invisus]|uniref:hemagglutinin repeat-containing protein n=1 Tax=Dialister invisus TaxID=218538 RepID=UPI002666A6B3|nr:hemagglutinin repeat-containing protein [Dialister invisus]
MNARDIQKNQKTDKAINKNNAVGINISLGSTGWKDQAETVTEEAKGSTVTAGRTAAVIAKEDIAVKGSTIHAKDIHLKAGNNIHILSSENKRTTIEDYKAKSGSIGAFLSKGVYGIGASYGKGKEQIEETTLTHTPSDITAKNTASLSSGNDTTIKGGIIKGNKVTANAGRMSIESEQDKKNYKETSKTSGLSISYTPGSAVTVSGGKGKTNTDSAYESVTKQAGIYAGQEGYDIQVKNNTRLKGAIIDSKAPAEKNKLTTGTLTWENIDNKAEYKAKASGITVSTHAISKLNPLGLGYVPTIPVKGKAGSITYAAIADSIITTTKEKTDKEISHDTANALNTLSEIFDKKKIEEKQEYVNILSQVGYRLIGDIAGHKENELNKKAEKARKENNSILAEKYEREAKKWSESGTNRIAMHGIMGALVSKEAGAGMTKGLTGAGLNALLQKELGKIKDKEVHKIASAAIGYLAGGKTGAAIAHQATTFNYLTHEQYKQYLDDMKNAKTEEEKKRLQKDWEAIDEKQRYSPISTPGTYWDLKTGRPFTVKEGGSLFEPVLVTATRAHGETIFESAMASGINTKVAKYLGRETVIGDALTLPWDIANDANIDKYGIRGARDRVLIDIYGTIGFARLAYITGGVPGIIIGIGGAIGINEYKDWMIPALTTEERKQEDAQYIRDIKDEMD